MKIYGKSLKYWFYAARGIYLPESDEERKAMHELSQNIGKILKETEPKNPGATPPDESS